MKTREEVEELKRDWVRDSDFSIADAKGFEEYREELLAFAEEQRTIWREQMRAAAFRHRQAERVHPDISSDIATDEYHRSWTQIQTCGGLTKRELFAGLAMQSLLSKDWPFEDVPADAVQMADRLLKALNPEAAS